MNCERWLFMAVAAAGIGAGYLIGLLQNTKAVRRLHDRCRAIEKELFRLEDPANEKK